MSNKKIGNEFENELADLLAERGYWVHPLFQSKSGQPADIIAVKNKRAFLIDAKVCSDNNFKLSRIEENQDLAMKRWFECGSGVGWFALKVDSGIYFVPHTILKDYSKTHSVFPYNEIVSWGFELDKWVKKWQKIG